MNRYQSASSVYIELGQTFAATMSRLLKVNNVQESAMAPSSIKLAQATETFTLRNGETITVRCYLVPTASSERS